MKRLGMLTPSSNTVLEPTTTAMLAALPGVTAHFARFKVTEIGLSEAALAQFDDSEILRAAELLADARVDVIGWNGTSAGWLGFARDERLCARITAVTGIPACTSILAMREIFVRSGITRVGLVTPYTDDVQARIMANWRNAGFRCVAERHLGQSDNFSFADITDAQVEAMVGGVAHEGCQAVAIVCTNMRGGASVAAMERRFNLPIYESIATTMWASLRLVGVSPIALSTWGRLFSAG